MNRTNISLNIQNNIGDVKSFGFQILKRHIYKFKSRGQDNSFAIFTKIGAIFMRPNHADMSVLRKIFNEREYDLDRIAQGKSVRSNYERMLRNGKIPLIIDAGANIGFASRFFAQAYPEAQVIAVEPDPDNIAICRQNIKAFPQIKIEEAAIGSRSGFVSLQCKQNEGYATRTHRTVDGVPVVTVNELRSRVENSELLIVKIDIEGFELDLFSENTEWVSRCAAIIVEPHDWLFPGAGSSRTMQQTMMSGDHEMLIIGENIVWTQPLTPVPGGFD